MQYIDHNLNADFFYWIKFRKELYQFLLYYSHTLAHVTVWFLFSWNLFCFPKNIFPKKNHSKYSHTQNQIRSPNIRSVCSGITIEINNNIDKKTHVFVRDIGKIIYTKPHCVKGKWN